MCFFSHKCSGSIVGIWKPFVHILFLRDFLIGINDIFCEDQFIFPPMKGQFSESLKILHLFLLLWHLKYFLSIFVVKVSGDWKLKFPSGQAHPLQYQWETIFCFFSQWIKLYNKKFKFDLKLSYSNDICKKLLKNLWNFMELWNFKD